MGKSITPAMENTNNSTSTQAQYLSPSVGASETPPMTNIKANTNLTISYRAD